MTNIYEFTTNYQDFLAAQRLIIRSSRKELIRYYFFVWLLPILGWIAAALVITDMALNQLHLPSWGADLLVVFALWSIVIPLTRWRTVKRRYRQMKNGRSDSDPMTLKFSETYLVSIIPGKGEGRVHRARIVKFVEDDKVALIYTGPLQYLILPKRAVPEGEWPLVRSWMASRFETKGAPA